MAYNSDGYIMIDFTEVDFRRTNQTIDGLYKRCVDVIGTNKFILVINANGRTPLPATCSFTNNQYVIDTCIYMFAISSNDNLFIRRNDVPASDIIDDSSISVDTTWSSNKIDTELDGKQDTLTAGDNISIVNNVISANCVKSFTYEGNGNTTNIIKFPIKPKVILSVGGAGYADWNLTTNIFWNVSVKYIFFLTGNVGSYSGAQNGTGDIQYNDVDNELTLKSNSVWGAMNTNNVVYTVHYI